jgi:atypical dual specificity phosphatase
MKKENKIYRGPEPGEDEILDLKNKGINSIVNLQKENISNKEFIESLGMKFFHIPIIDHTAPTIEQIEEFILIATDEKNLPLYVHCFAGLERTGTMVASYLVYTGWDCEDAIAYNYHETKWPLLESQKEVVREYANKIRRLRGINYHK